MLHLIRRALLRRLVGAVRMDLRSVPKPAAGKMVVGYFDHDLRIDRFPFPCSFSAPAARAAGSISGETRFLPKRFEFFRQGRAFARFECRSEADMMEQAVVI